MTLLVTAASGRLGRLVVDALLTRGVVATDIVAGARTPANLDDLAGRGVRVVELDYDRPETITAALAGVDSVLLISSSSPGGRAEGHANVVTAARAAGVRKLVYTSAPQATTADFVLAPDHAATEAAIAESGIPAVIVRNNWYIENYADDILRAAKSGVLVSSTGDGRVASATRADYAEGAAVVLVEDGHIGEVYEFGGDRAWDFAELAAAASDALGRDVEHRALSTAEHIALLESFGLDAGTAGFVAGIDDGIRRGVLADTPGDLGRILGRPTTPLAESLRGIVGVQVQSV